MKVKDFLTTVKANRNTYYNLSRKDILMFKDLYNYIKKYKENYLSGILIQQQINTINKTYSSDYLRKYKTMELIASNIIHYNNQPT